MGGLYYKRIPHNNSEKMRFTSNTTGQTIGESTQYVSDKNRMEQDLSIGDNQIWTEQSLSAKHCDPNETLSKKSGITF